jgi:hypothetical protein
VLGTVGCAACAVAGLHRGGDLLFSCRLLGQGFHKLSCAGRCRTGPQCRFECPLPRCGGAVKFGNRSASRADCSGSRFRIAGVTRRGDTDEREHRPAQWGRRRSRWRRVQLRGRRYPDRRKDAAGRYFGAEFRRRSARSGHRHVFFGRTDRAQGRAADFRKPASHVECCGFARRRRGKNRSLAGGGRGPAP